MAARQPNRVIETSTTTGAGAYTLLGAIAGFRTFAAGGLANGDTVPYLAEEVDANGVPNGGWEYGLGTWGTGGILTRTTIYESSNTNLAVVWAAGTRRITVPVMAQNLQPAFNTMEVLTAGTTWTCPPNIYKLRLRGQGGGASGGRSTGANWASSGAGGGYFEKLVSVVPGTAYTYAIGAGGAAVTVNGTAGNSGTATTFNDGTTTYTANGGTGALAGATAGGTATNGDINITGQAGYNSGPGIAATIMGPYGGSTPLGLGGFSYNNTTTAPTGYGSGSAGGANGLSSLAGRPGVLILEY